MLNKANNFIFLAKSFGSSKIIRNFANRKQQQPFRTAADW